MSTSQLTNHPCKRERMMETSDHKQMNNRSPHQLQQQKCSCSGGNLGPRAAGGGGGGRAVGGGAVGGGGSSRAVGGGRKMRCVSWRSVEYVPWITMIEKHVTNRIPSQYRDSHTELIDTDRTASDYRGSHTEFIDTDRTAAELIDTDRTESYYRGSHTELIDTDRNASDYRGSHAEFIDTDRTASELIDTDRTASELIDTDRTESYYRGSHTELIDTDRNASDYRGSHAEFIDTDRTASELIYTDRNASDYRGSHEEFIDTDRTASEFIDTDRTASDYRGSHAEFIDTERTASELIDTDRTSSDYRDSHTELIDTKRTASELIDRKRTASDNRDPDCDFSTNEHQSPTVEPIGKGRTIAAGTDPLSYEESYEECRGTQTPCQCQTLQKAGQTDTDREFEDKKQLADAIGRPAQGGLRLSSEPNVNNNFDTKRNFKVFKNSAVGQRRSYFNHRDSTEHAEEECDSVVSQVRKENVENPKHGESVSEDSTRMTTPEDCQEHKENSPGKMIRQHKQTWKQRKEHEMASIVQQASIANDHACQFLDTFASSLSEFSPDVSHFRPSNLLGDNSSELERDMRLIHLLIQNVAMILGLDLTSFKYPEHDREVPGKIQNRSSCLPSDPDLTNFQNPEHGREVPSEIQNIPSCLHSDPEVRGVGTTTLQHPEHGRQDITLDTESGKCIQQQRQHGNEHVQYPGHERQDIPTHTSGKSMQHQHSSQHVQYLGHGMPEFTHHTSSGKNIHHQHGNQQYLRHGRQVIPTHTPSGDSIPQHHGNELTRANTNNHASFVSHLDHAVKEYVKEPDMIKYGTEDPYDCNDPLQTEVLDSGKINASSYRVHSGKTGANGKGNPSIDQPGLYSEDMETKPNPVNISSNKSNATENCLEQTEATGVPCPLYLALKYSPFTSDVRCSCFPTAVWTPSDYSEVD